MDNAQNDIDINDRDAVLKEVKRICDSYAHNVEELQKNTVEIRRLEDIRRTSQPGYGEELIAQRISDIERENKKYQREVDFFSASMAKVKERTFHVMFQLYAEEISWDFIRDQYGKPMCRDAIARERRRAFDFMAEYYRSFDWSDRKAD